MAYRTKLVRLEAAEAAAARELVERHGAKEAAKLLGLNEYTLRKGACGELVHPLTLSTLRAKLEKLERMP